MSEKTLADRVLEAIRRCEKPEQLHARRALCALYLALTPPEGTDDAEPRMNADVREAVALSRKHFEGKSLVLLLEELLVLQDAAAAAHAIFGLTLAEELSETATAVPPEEARKARLKLGAALLRAEGYIVVELGTHWKSDETVDGGGLPLRKHAARIAADLPPATAASLAAELGNVLVPLQVFLRSGKQERAEKCLERLFALLSACRAQADKVHSTGTSPVPRPKRGFYEVLREGKWHRIEVVDTEASSVRYIDSDGERSMGSLAQWAKMVQVGEIRAAESYSEHRRRQLEVFDADPKNAHLASERCHAGMQDGECRWKSCPQERDGEPGKSGRHCPLDRDEEEA